MKPTPAQMEAAIEAFCKSAGYPMEARYAEGSNLKRDLTTALTAAAEVEDEQCDENKGLWPSRTAQAKAAAAEVGPRFGYSDIQWRDEMIRELKAEVKRLTAAAEVGDDKRGAMLAREYEQIALMNTTIERCAHAVEALHPTDDRLAYVVTAIRAMKDKP